PVLHADGTVAAPSISFSSNPATGFWYNPANGGLGVTANGSSVQRSFATLSVFDVQVGFASGSQSAPGISWQAEPNSGFYRASGSDISVSILNARTMSWQPSATYIFTPLNLPNQGQIQFTNPAGNAQWEALHGTSAS